jgi:DNA-directed RNA polymerase specialized sigma24 family protein
LLVYSVLTGDLVKSSTFGAKREDVLRTLHELFDTLKKNMPKDIDMYISDIFRGDSFQIVVSDAEYAFLIAIFLRAQLIRKSTEGFAFDARISIGIGDVEYLYREKITESDGEAFQLSGRFLDEMPTFRRFVITTSSEEQNKILEVFSAFVDALTSRWTPEQAEAVSHWIFGETQTSMAKKLGVTQSAIQQRLQLAGHFAIDACRKYFASIMQKYKAQD